jgi:ATP-dependent RNA helicase RhlE
LLGERLLKEGLPVAVLHGNKIQRTRENMLKRFRDGSCPILVSTDLAARGIDVEDLPLIINFDLPNEPETFIHRIGRTARAGASGVALSFCDPTEKGYLREILRHLGAEIPVVKDHPFHSEQALNYSGRANTQKHTPKPAGRRKKEQNKWRLAPSETAQLHRKEEQKPKKNARRNPKRKSS